MPVCTGILWVSELHLVLSHPLHWHPNPLPPLRACIGGILSSQLWDLFGSNWPLFPLSPFLFHSLFSSFLPFFFPPSCTTQSFGKLMTWLIFFLALAPPSAVSTLLKKANRGTYAWCSLLSSHILQNICGGVCVCWGGGVSSFPFTFMASTKGKERPVLHFSLWLFSWPWDNRLCYCHVFFWNLSFEESTLTFATVKLGFSET